MKILITGACGFIGRNLISELESHGHDLVLTDRQRLEDATVFVPGLAERAASPLVTQWPFLLGDIMDHEQMRRHVEGVDAVVHLAASPTGLPEQGVDTFKYNALGTFNLLDACRLQGVSRFIAASSINAYGTFYWRINQEPVVYNELPLTEDFRPVPQDPYSLSKWVNEETCAAFHRAYGVKTAALRFGAVWTDEMYRRTIEAGLSPTAAWSDDLFTWVHVGDIVMAIRQALEAEQLPGYGAYTLNAADTRCPEPTMELLRQWKPDLVGRLSAPLQGRDSLISTAKAKAAFGYEPRYRLDEGIRT
ncbi:NAD-dependent epimerase/dehydratase family protein [Cohnella nanjingensis]|uniref:NAD(P)-dependent oxidoreductase n=1 Tax=Cohnella nanjingensis TaxID=1387779 RepID=A0A7X0RPA4_9BACL|nr:NAD(P)-dependent oxidoreductase [Cohnella nanjingensis]MBB6670021.1 NAD(P)-dependent oxidoreductase [Cohnella nanjingensis]